MSRLRAAAVFFDVDFTLIYPGPTFQGEGYARFCERYGMTIDSAKFDDAVRAASSVLDAAQDHVYDADIFVCYTRRIVEEMGGTGPQLNECAAEIYREWAACQHFFTVQQSARIEHPLDDDVHVFRQIVGKRAVAGDRQLRLQALQHKSRQASVVADDERAGAYTSAHAQPLPASDPPAWAHSSTST